MIQEVRLLIPPREQEGKLVCLEDFPGGLLKDERLVYDGRFYRVLEVIKRVDSPPLVYVEDWGEFRTSGRHCKEEESDA